MDGRKISIYLICFMLVIFAISSLQLITQELTMVSGIWGKSYKDKVDSLDKSYYHNYFYRYYDWLNAILPPTLSFSMLYNKQVEKVYLRYEHKLNYYLYPRYILPGEEKLLDYERGNVSSIRSTEDIGNIEYSDLVFSLNNEKAGLKNKNGIKYTILNGRTYYLVAVKDDKGLLMERSFIKKNISSSSEWGPLRKEFKALYGIELKKADLYL